MFACALYPAERPAFLVSADIEFRQFVRRVQHHPSIAVWAGNNENEAVLSQNWLIILDYQLHILFKLIFHRLF